jgi:hypothetical protein
MTVSTLTNRVTYLGNGSTTQFAVPFKVLDETHLVVKRRLLSTNEIDYTYIGTDYSYSGIGDDAGTLTLDGSALSSAYQLEIERVVSYTQALDIVNAGGFYPETVEEQLDLTTMQIQQIAAQADDIETRAIMVPVGEEAPDYDDFAATFKGDPGGSAMAVGAFTILSTLIIPVGTDLIQTSEYAPGWGVGGALYAADTTVDATYVIAHPTLTARSANGRGWRIVGPIVNITSTGIRPGDVAGYNDDNSDAVDALMLYMRANDPLFGQLGTGAPFKLVAPPGLFRFARRWEVKIAIWLEGFSNSLRDGYMTHFDFDEDGFMLNRTNTLNNAVESPATTGADGFRIENIFCTSRAAIGTGFHGAFAVCRGDFIRCSFNYFPGDGIRVETPTTFGATSVNANSLRITNCLCVGNGGSGIKLIGGDANAIVTVGCGLDFNGEFGLFDNAFLSNSHTGHHTEGNGLGIVYAGHKITAVSSYCYFPYKVWQSGVALVPTATGTYRYNVNKLYRLLRAGGGNTANAPTHTTVDTAGGVTEADGYRWAYAGTSSSRRYHVAIGQTVAASTTEPGTNSAVWVPISLNADDSGSGAGAGIPLWVTGMTWKEGGSYAGTSLAAETVWTACYSEGGQPPAQIVTPQVWVGGQSVPSLWSTCIQLRGEQGAINNPKGILAARQFHDGSDLRAIFGADMTTGMVMQIAHSTLHSNSFIMGAGRDTYFLLDGQASNYITFTGPLTAFTGGRAVAQSGVVNIPRLFLGTGINARNIDYGTTAPATGYHAAGEIVYNIAPAAGGKVGWVCTTAGEPGTWKAFGGIDA